MREVKSGVADERVEGLRRAAGHSGRIGGNGDVSSPALPSGRAPCG